MLLYEKNHSYTFVKNFISMIRLLILTLTFSFISKVSAQETIAVSKEELLQKVSEKNLQLKLSQQDVVVAKAELLQTRAMYLPNVNASYTAITTNNPLMAFGSRLNQERITMQDFDPSKLNSPDNISNFATKLEVQQPIYNQDMVYQKKAGQVKADALSIKAERTSDYIKFEMAKAYMQLQLAYKAVETLENAKNTTLANKKVIDNYFKNGMIQKSDVLYMDVRVSEIESQLQFGKSNVRNASDYIYFLLGEESNNRILKPTEKLDYQTYMLEENTKLNSFRKDILAYEKSLEAYDLMIKSAKSKFLPRLNAFGSFEVYDNKPYQFDANGYLLGLQLSWNVFDGLKSKSEQEKYKTERIKAETELQQYTQQSQLEINKASRQVKDADNKVNLSKQALEQSKEAYRIRKNRYDQGLEKSSDLLVSETLMSQKELDYNQAIFEYNTALEYYKFLKN